MAAQRSANITRVPVDVAGPPLVPEEVLVVEPAPLPADEQLAFVVEGEFRRRGLKVRRGRTRIGRGGSADLHLMTWPDGDRAKRAVGVATVGDAPAVTQVLTELENTFRSRRVLIASPRSFCAGVDRAIEIVERLLAQRGSPLYVRKQIVHNAHVVRDLRDRGAIFVDELDEVPSDATVVFSAHGVSPKVREAAAERGLEVIDATCPLVTKVHAEARRFARRGDTVVFIGHGGHEETEGTLGEAPDRMVLVESIADVDDLDVPDPDRVSYLTQTTLAVDETEQIVRRLAARFPKLRAPGSDDICYATTNRQRALHSIAADSDLVLVVGSANSSNSVRLVELARRHGTPANLIDDASEIELAWLASAETVGITAGASAPPGLVDRLVDMLAGLGPVQTEERKVTEENVRFELPGSVRGA